MLSNRLPPDGNPPTEMSTLELDDRALLARVAVADRAAFEQLYRRLYPRLFRYVHRLTRRPDLVEEVVDDAFVVVWQSADRFEGRSTVSTWALGIAHRKALKRLARLRREPVLPAGFDPRSAREPEVEPEAPARLARRETAIEVGRALATLPEEQRAVVILTFFEELSYPEIARVLDCPVNTVKSRMFEARKKLRRRLPELAAGFVRREEARDA